MKFGSVHLEDAIGGTLAHALSLPSGRLKKGHVLTVSDVENIGAAGHASIVVAQLDNSDVEENEAAQMISATLVGSHIEAAEPFTGRVNLHAKSAGLFQASGDAINALNRIDPAITIATLADNSFVEAGRMVATVKLIPFAAPRAAVEAAIELATREFVMRVEQARPHKVGLIATRLPHLKASTMDKTASVLAKRLERFGSSLINEVRTDHEASTVAAALSELEPSCDMIIIFGASAITDSADVIPAGIIEAGGDVHRFGMPVDPGNLLLTGTFKNRPVIGAPGCARSPVENGFDWVLQRLLCGLPVDDDYISALGVGGLLMEIHGRPQPREAGDE